MNILPKKRWHVRTKDNIARVRKDEAEAREEERKKQEKLELAESEARVNFLRKRKGVSEKHSTCEESSQQQPQQSEVEHNAECTSHVNLFADYKAHIKTTSKELEKEKKDEQEKYEKQIGYLTYLGQDTNEALRLKSWYEVAPKRLDVGAERGEINEKDFKIKHNHDPLTLINALLPPDSKLETKPTIKRQRTPSPVENIANIEEPKDFKNLKKHKGRKHNKERDKNHTKKDKHSKHKKHKSKSKDMLEEQLEKRLKLEKLRKERLRRETAERARQDVLLAPKETTKPQKPTPITTKVVQKYNSQFNPELAKQNMN